MASIDTWSGPYAGKMMLQDREGREMQFAWVENVGEARELWQRIAGLTAGTELVGFSVVGKTGKVMYQGNYVTDEC